jgi:hypothetical protein
MTREYICDLCEDCFCVEGEFKGQFKRIKLNDDVNVIAVQPGEIRDCNTRREIHLAQTVEDRETGK